MNKLLLLWILTTKYIWYQTLKDFYWSMTVICDGAFRKTQRKHLWELECFEHVSKLRLLLMNWRKFPCSLCSVWALLWLNICADQFLWLIDEDDTESLCGDQWLVCHYVVITQNFWKATKCQCLFTGNSFHTESLGKIYFILHVLREKIFYSCFHLIFNRHRTDC